MASHIEFRLRFHADDPAEKSALEVLRSSSDPEGLLARVLAGLKADGTPDDAAERIRNLEGRISRLEQGTRSADAPPKHSPAGTQKKARQGRPVDPRIAPEAADVIRALRG